MRFLKLVYLDICGHRLQEMYVPTREEFERYVEGVELTDEDFNIETFPPGTSGESRLFRFLEASLADSETDQPLFDRNKWRVRNDEYVLFFSRLPRQYVQRCQHDMHRRSLSQ